ncbi:MAG: hypothetical protein QME46_00770 [Thermoanaerobacteraceae bacterium]|nr:hypothetical protein [Thermoanaerobacteraceae bacterium]
MGKPEDIENYIKYQMDDVEVYISKDIDIGQGEVKFMMDGLAWFKITL